jgi:preprotein translocase subunit SecF
MFQLIRNDMNIQFTRMRWFGFALSAVLMGLGLFAIIQMARGHARLGVDFGGGTSMEVEFVKPVSADTLRASIKDPKIEDLSLQSITDPGHVKYMFRVFAPQVPTGETSNLVAEILRQKLPDNTATILSAEEVGPSVSAHLREQALMALFWAMVGILIYIWWRFDFRFAVAATVATVHDILAVLGIMFICGFEVNLLLLTALLTIAGYSLNDTVVIFDRIRENLRLHRKEEYNQLVNNSINETLSRTIITSIATLFVVVSLVALAGEVIFTFSFAMLVGILIGGYSTIFVASNLIVEWNLRAPMHR